MSPDSVLHMLRQVLKRAGLERIRFHDFRHTFSVLALQNGGNVKNPLRHAGPLQRRVHPGHLRPRYRLYAEAGGERSGEFPLRYSPALTAPNSRMGHGLGQTGVAKSNYRKKRRETSKTAETQRISAVLVRPEGFELPAFWSVACLRERNGCFPVRLVVSAQDFGTLKCCLFQCFRGEISCSGSDSGSKATHPYLPYDPGNPATQPGQQLIRNSTAPPRYLFC